MAGEPGDSWTGPHAGIPYLRTAAGDDVYYRTYPHPDVERRVKQTTFLIGEHVEGELRDNPVFTVADGRKSKSRPGGP